MNTRSYPQSETSAGRCDRCGRPSKMPNSELSMNGCHLGIVHKTRKSSGEHLQVQYNGGEMYAQKGKNMACTHAHFYLSKPFGAMIFRGRPVKPRR